MAEIRAVLDTNVIISAVLLSGSVPRKAFDLAVERGKVLLSESAMVELNDVLCRPKFDKYLPSAKRGEFLAALLRDAEVIVVTCTITECRDPKDNKFLELAVSGNATHLVSGDADLLVLNPFRGIAISSPAEFLANVQRDDA